MMRFGDDARPCLVKGSRLMWDEARKQHVLLVPEGALMLNRTAAEVLELCTGERTVAEIVAALQEKYPGAPVAEDVQELLGRIAERGLIADARE